MCSLFKCLSLYYETRFESISNPEEKIFRIKNEFHYQSLCGAGRFGYDYENREGSKDPAKLQEAIEAIESAKTIRFNSMITNEEALMLSRALKRRKVLEFQLNLLKEG